eukprot:20196-Hanusia_phi.AAC.1
MGGRKLINHRLGRRRSRGRSRSVSAVCRRSENEGSKGKEVPGYILSRAGWERLSGGVGAGGRGGRSDGGGARGGEVVKEGEEKISRLLTHRCVRKRQCLACHVPLLRQSVQQLEAVAIILLYLRRRKAKDQKLGALGSQTLEELGLLLEAWRSRTKPAIAPSSRAGRQQDSTELTEKEEGNQMPGRGP